MRKAKVTKIVQTCNACPSQWDIYLEDGRMVYCRYRWGDLSVRISESPTEDSMDAVSGVHIDDGSIKYPEGDAFDGVLSTEELLEALKDTFDWSLVTTTKLELANDGEMI